MFITVIYMFRAKSCSSSGGQTVLIQHLVSSLAVSGRPVHTCCSKHVEDLICCWPCILVIINFRFQLNAQYLISVTMLLYMFRAPLRPSSGGPLYIYIWFYVSLFWWPCSWNPPTARSPKETDIEPDVNIQRSSWGWAQGCPKHIEEHSYWN